MSEQPLRRNAINYNAHGKHDRMLMGVLLIAVGETLLVMMGASIKHLSAELSLLQIVFFRNVFALLFIFPFVLKIGMNSLSTQNRSLHFRRGLFGVSAMFCMYYSFSTLKLTEAVLLKATSPILLSLIAWMMLRERLPALSWVAIGLAFVGVAIIVNPESVEVKVQLGFLAGLAGALLAAMAKIMVRRLGRTEPSKVIVFYFALSGTLFTLPLAVWYWQSIEFAQWGLLAFIGLLATLGQLFITKAFTVAKAGKVAMFGYLSIPIAGLMGWLLWDESLDLPLLLGALTIVSAGALSFYAARRNDHLPVIGQ